MKRLWIALNLLILYPSLWLSRAHVVRSDVALKLDLVWVWSSAFLRMMKLKPLLENQNYIPLEDGYVFILDHKSAFDALALAQVLPLDFTFVLDVRDPIFLIRPILSSLKPLNVDTHVVDFTHLSDVLETQLKHHKNLVIFNAKLTQQKLNSSFFTWIKTQGLTLIPISNTSPPNLYAWRTQNWRLQVQLPIPKDEYEGLSDDALQDLVQHALVSSATGG